ncbi:hypothetical protein H0H92_005870, partial [Tricholoma furcatifolium]
MPGAAEKLPLEIKANIANYCSPATLTSLAVVQRTFQVEAERHLYARLSIRSSKPFKGLFETLAVNGRKAAYIRFFQVDAFVSYGIPEHKIVAEAVISTLTALVSLKDLRLKLPLREHDFSEKKNEKFTIGKELSHVLKSQHFQQLETLFCNDWLHVAEIVKCQRSVRNLGIYGWGDSTIRDLEQLGV